MNADIFATQMEEIQRILRNNMLIAQADYERHVNQNCGPSPQYKIKNLIWLNIKNLFTERPYRKLKNRCASTFADKK